MHTAQLGSKLITQKEVCQYSLKKGLQEFGHYGKDTVMTELNQIHVIEVSQLQHPSQITSIQKQKVLKSLVFLEEKQSKKINRQMCANGFKQWEQEENAM